MIPDIQKTNAAGWQRHTDEQKEFVRTAWEAGKSAGVIAAEFSTRFGLKVSRNVIIGMKARMGLRGRQTRICRSYHNQKYVSPKAKPQPPRGDLQPPEPTGPIGDFPPDGGCLWITSDTPEFQCCGQPKFGRRPYCEFHAAKARDPVRKPMVGTSRSDRQFR